MYDPVTMTNKPDVALTNEKYEELIRDSERIKVIGRLLDANCYLSVKDIAAVLGIDYQQFDYIKKDGGDR